jgi:FixJ family two-component response regulator
MQISVQPCTSSPPAKIAIIDDDGRVLAALRNLFASEGYPTELFRSAEAFLASDVAQIRCVISDLSMRPVDGLGVLRRVRDTLHAVPVIIITGKPNEHPDAFYLDQGAAGFFRKPIDADELIALVRSLI